MTNGMYWFIPLGFFLGMLGTLVGAGGGFLLMPLLLYMYPAEAPEHLTGISLAVVFANALSGTYSYARKGRIDWTATREFSFAAIPGAILGALSTSLFDRSLFDLTFGVLLAAASIYLFIRGGRKVRGREIAGGRRLVERDGTVHHISYSRAFGIGLAFVIGYVSSLIGIGGGIIHVPVMSGLLNFPIHIATATSHSVLAVTSCVGLLVHVVQGRMGDMWFPILLLAPGVVIGAQVGAKLSDRIKGPLILRILAVALLSVAVRLIWR